MVLPLFLWPSFHRRFEADRQMAGHSPAHRSDKEKLSARNTRLPSSSKAGPAALGLRCQKNLNNTVSLHFQTPLDRVPHYGAETIFLTGIIFQEGYK